MSQVVLDDESHVVATVQEWLGWCRWAWGETHASEPGPRLHYWGTHICTGNGKTYATKKSYSVGANINVLYVSPPLQSNALSASTPNHICENLGQFASSYSGTLAKELSSQTGSLSLIR